MTVTPPAARPGADGVTLVLPCLDEADSVEACVTEATTAMAATSIPFQVLVVDNGSTDGSDVLAAQAGARVVHESAKGYGSALRRGIDEATTDVVVMADADGTYELSRLPALIAPVRAGEADVVLGERLASATNESMPWLHRHVGTPVLSWLNRRAAPGLDVHDSQSGYRAFRREAVIDLGLQGTGMEYASEMLIEASRAGLRITEVPTEYRVRAGESKLSTVRDGLRHLRVILLLAPQLFLRIPGIVLLILGLTATVVGLASPEGVALGSLRWQPIFLSTILVVLGSLGIMAAAATERFSPLAIHAGSDLVGRESRALHRTTLAGAALLLSGLGLDLALVLFHADDAGDVGRRLALAGLATSLILVGAMLLVGGMLGRLLVAQLDYLRSRTAGASSHPTDAAEGSRT